MPVMIAIHLLNQSLKEMALGFYDGYVVVNFLSQLIFIFLLFWGMVMSAYEFETKEKQKLTKIKN